MIKQNLLLLHFKKRETALKWLCLSFGYFILFVFLQNPLHKTISLIGKEHLILFTAFCLIYSLSMLVNFLYMKRSFHIKSKPLYYLSITVSALFGFVATTLMYDKSVGEISVFATVVHWIIGFGGIVITTVSVLVFLLHFAKDSGSKILKTLFAFCTGVCILDLLVFVLLSIVSKGDLQKSKNGFLEIIPMAVTYLVIYVINHTDIVSSRSERDKDESELQESDKSIFSSVCFAFGAMAFTALTLFAFVRNPVHFTISMTGVDYPIGFAITCILMVFAFILNFIKMFSENNFKNPIAWFLAVSGPLAIILCVVSPTKLGDELDPLHSVSALVFFFFIFGAFIMYYMHFAWDKERRKILIVLLSVLAAVLVAMLFLFVIFKQKYGRTGLTELVPLELFFLCFLLENHSDYFKTSKEKASAEILS